MKRKNFSGIFSAVFAVATVITLASCSQDDEYYEDGLFTRADEMMTRSEGGQGYSPYTAYYLDRNNCGGVALAILYGEMTTMQPEYAYVEVKNIAGSCEAMPPSRVCEVGMQLGLYCNQYKSIVCEDSLLALNVHVNGKIVFVSMPGESLDHAIIANGLVETNKTGADGAILKSYTITGRDRQGNRSFSASRVTGIIL